MEFLKVLDNEFDRDDFTRHIFGLMVFLRDGGAISPALDRRFFSDERGVLGSILEIDAEISRFGVLFLLLPGVI